ncbi:MAG: hypothetical protein U0790_21335 [Isosphaeraceae bacterium]
MEYPGSGTGRTAHLSIRGESLTSPVDPSGSRAAFLDLRLTAGPAELESWVDEKKVANRAMFVTVTRVAAE